MWKPVVICHQLRSPENLGAIARLMANFGCDELLLSDPATHDFRGAEKLGVGGEGVLKHFSVARDLDEALGGVVYAVGTTSRAQLKRFAALSPEEGAARLAAHAARGKVALVLGGEKRGLSDEELARCQDAVVIPTPGPQPSMNVSHAAAVLLYACSRAEAPGDGARGEARGAAGVGAGEPGGAASSGRAPGARLETVQALEEKMRVALLACEFLNPQAPEHVLKELSRSLVHGQLTQREAELWLAAFEHVRRVTSAGASRSAR